jgi:hypothetical protein
MKLYSRYVAIGEPAPGVPCRSVRHAPSLRAFRSIALTLFASVGYGVSAYATNYEDFTTWQNAQSYLPGELPSGTYGPDGLSKLAPYLAPGLQDLMTFDAFQMTVTATQSYPPPAEFRAATDEHQSKVVLAADGIVTGYVAGQPFSADQIEAAEPQRAGYMLAWNHKFRWQYQGYRSDVMISMVKASDRANPSGLTPGLTGTGDLERSMTLRYHRVLLAHLAYLPDSGYRMDVDDADEILWKEYVEFLDPFNIQGTRFVVERPLDPLIEDQVFSYLPTERRVRRLSAKERADRWMGTNMTLDDFEAFAGRILDNDWRYIGQKTVLSVMNSEHDAAVLVGPMNSVPADRWELRDAYLVESIPKWEGHPYGRRVLLLDKETFVVLYSLVFDHDDVLWKIFANIYRQQPRTASTPTENTMSKWAATLSIDIKEKTNSVFRSLAPADYSPISASAIRRTFEVSNLTDGR